MNEATLASQDWWNEQNLAYPLQVAGREDTFRQWLERVVPPVAPKGSKRCIEIGCYPGRYLAVIGQLGYEVNGLDLTPGVETRLPEWLRQQGCETGRFSREDFLTFKEEGGFDLVYSVGFLEHFVDWTGILTRHADLVAPEGLLVLMVPNFRGAVQWALHRWLDSENLVRHNTASMCPHKWAEIVAARGFRIRHAGYSGRFLFWVGSQNRTPRQLAFLDFIARWQRRWGRTLVPEGTAAFAPYCTMVAERTWDSHGG